MDLLVTLEDRQHAIGILGELVDGKTKSELMDYLATERIGKQTLAEAFAPLFEGYADHGRDGVTAKMFHEANREESIWQFRKGKFRIYCFKDPEEKRLIILSHGKRKKTEKACAEDIQKAVQVRNQYLEKKHSGLLHQKTLKEVVDEA